MFKQKTSIILILIIFLFSYASNVFGADIRVINIHDGDTITVKKNHGRKIRLRFFGIDAPELAQNYGYASRNHLIDLLKNKKVTYKVENKDVYGRSVSTIYANGENVNLKMVQDGYAWYYRYFSKSKILEKAEKNAKINKLGLWNDPNPTPPWNFRQKQKKLNNAHHKPFFKSSINHLHICVNIFNYSTKLQPTPCGKGYFTVIGK